MKRFLTTTLLLIATLQLSCSNIFRKAANPNTNEALYEDAMKAIDKADYATALEKFAAMTTDYSSNPTVIEQWAGAYAGKCGLDFVTFFSELGEASISGSTVFRYFMGAFDQTVVDPVSCKLAELKMNEISTNPGVRTPSQNLFMMILGMVKVGTYLRYEADHDSTDNLGDGTMDAGFDACTVSGTDLPSNTAIVGQFSDNDIKQIVTGLGQIITNFAYVGAALGGGDAGSSLSALMTSCALLPTNPCTVTDVALVDAATVTLMRQLIHTSPTNPTITVGIGGCNSANVALCCGL